jgi:hypothetical protein
VKVYILFLPSFWDRGTCSDVMISLFFLVLLYVAECILISKLCSSVFCK